jgi:hypothetical protein
MQTRSVSAPFCEEQQMRFADRQEQPENEVQSGPALANPAFQQHPISSVLLEAAGLGNNASEYSLRLLQVVVNFINSWNNDIAEEFVQQLLQDIDFRRPITLVRLPRSTFVRTEAAVGGWYTDTGMSTAEIRRNPLMRRMPFHQPTGVIPGLQAVSRTAEKCPAIAAVAGNRHFTSSTNSAHGNIVQYLVMQEHQMRPV